MAPFRKIMEWINPFPEVTNEEDMDMYKDSFTSATSSFQTSASVYNPVRYTASSYVIPHMPDYSAQGWQNEYDNASTPQQQRQVVPSWYQDPSWFPHVAGARGLSGTAGASGMAGSSGTAFNPYIDMEEYIKQMQKYKIELPPLKETQPQIQFTEVADLNKLLDLILRCINVGVPVDLLNTVKESIKTHFDLQKAIEQLQDFLDEKEENFDTVADKILIDLLVR